MGIAELWPILPLDERVSFAAFLTQFVQKHGRPPRLAIDAYMFLFWSLRPEDETPDPDIDIRDESSLMGKLWYLVQNNVSFVVVFDGKYKPDKLRHGHIPELSGSRSYDDTLQYFLGLHSSRYPEGLNIIEYLKRSLSRNRMDWIQAPGEGEAECAWLQRLGVVDYAVSDDSDTLVFGATGVLRNFNRVRYLDEKHRPVRHATEYYVTPVHMSHITEQTNLTRDHLVMIAVLRGGDYSTGAESIGISRAKELAFCGTTVLLNLPGKAQQDFGAFPDLTSMFANTFLDSEKRNMTLPNPFYAMKLDLDRAYSLAAFNAYFNEFLLQSGKEVFGRKTKLKSEVKIDDYFAMLYYFPMVNTKIFKFLPISTSFGELTHVPADLKWVDVSSQVSRFNLLQGPRIIGKLVIKNGVQTYKLKFYLSFDGLPLPRERKKSLKAFVLKFLKDKNYWRLISFDRISEFEGTPMAVLKFNRVELNEYVYHGRRDLDMEVLEKEDDLELVASPENPEEDPDSVLSSPEKDEDRLIAVKIPLECVSFVSPEYVDAFRNRPPKRLSPLKRKPAFQKQTLDCMLPRLLPIRDGDVFNQSDLSPTRSRSGSSNVRESTTSSDFGVNLNFIREANVKLDALKPSLEHTRAPGEKISPSLPGTAKKPSRGCKGQKSELLRGQSTIMTFIESRRVGRSIEQPLYVCSEEETYERDKPYEQMRVLFKSGPSFLEPPTPESGRPPSSPEVSPTKRHRRFMAFSAESSPIKAKPEAREPW